MRLSISFLVVCLSAALSKTHAESNLRGKRQQKQQQVPSTFRVTVLDNLVRQEDGSFMDVDEYMIIPIVDGVESSDFYSIDLPEEIETNHKELIETGELYIQINEPAIEFNTVTFPDSSAVKVLKENPITTSTRKLAVRGTRSLAVLVVSMAEGENRNVGYSIDQITKGIFNNQVSLRQQLTRCSNGKFTIRNAGVYQVTVPGAATSFPSASDLRNQALSLLAVQQRVPSANVLADHVMVILPPNNFEGFVGNAGVNHWVSTLNNLWSLDVMVYMHEFAHNLGLNHAYLSDDTPDYSSYMSATGWSPNLNGPLKCFNAASNQILGWFDDRTERINFAANPVQQVNLAAFSEASVRDDTPILLEVGEYSVQYNFASEFNAGTELLRNEVTVAHAESGKTVVEKQGLVPNGSIFTADNFAGTGKTLKIQACERINAGARVPNSMVVGLSLGQSGSPCDAPPTPPTTTQATTTTTTTRATAPAADNDKPICPNTSSRILTVIINNRTKKTKRIRCSMIDMKVRNQRMCFNAVSGQVFQQVKDVCVQECAAQTNICIRA